MTASGTTWGLLGQPEAQAGKCKPPPPVKKKVEEDKGLSAYDQKLLASTHHKEVHRLSIEGQKASPLQAICDVSIAKSQLLFSVLFWIFEYLLLSTMFV